MTTAEVAETDAVGVPSWTLMYVPYITHVRSSSTDSGT